MCSSDLVPRPCVVEATTFSTQSRRLSKPRETTGSKMKMPRSAFTRLHLKNDVLTINSDHFLSAINKKIYPEVNRCTLRIWLIITVLLNNFNLQISSLGCGNDHVLDAVSQVEQITRDHGFKDEKAAWRIYLRKEVFEPWEDFTMDHKATNLIYEQIKYGAINHDYEFAEVCKLVIINVWKI